MEDDKLKRAALWNSRSVKNPIAKQLLQGKGELGAKIIPNLRKKKLDEALDLAQAEILEELAKQKD